MNLIVNTILFVLLTFTISPSCELGCLACNEKSKCILCDFKNSYHLKDFHCFKTNIDQCLGIDLNGNCLHCQPHYFLDSSNNKCYLVPIPQQQSQCLSYSDQSNCLSCSGNYYPQDGQCNPLPAVNQIPNCLAYYGFAKCFQCDSQYLPNYLGTKCVENSVAPNCLLQTNIQCLECPSDHLQNNDYLRIQVQKSIQTLSLVDKQSDFNQYQENLQKGFYTLIKQKILFQDNCLKKSVSFCSDFQEFDQCKQCNSGYYLDSGKCIKQPQEAIPFCMIYKNLVECSKCIQGYFRETNNKCVPVIQINNCDAYDGSETQTICVRCSIDYYLFTNSCSKRQNLIDLCEEYELSADVCKRCQNLKSRFTLTKDKLKCIKEISHCQEYVDFDNQNKDTDQLECLSCINGYYWSLFEKRCMKGDVSFCETYQQKLDQCQSCVNGYYLQVDQDGVNICVPHAKQQGCSSYSNSIKNQCSSCDEGYIMLSLTTECLPIQFEGCLAYSNQSQCSKCEDGYDLTNGICNKLKENSNCLVSQNGDCQKCALNYLLAYGDCYPKFDYQRENCLIFSETNSNINNQHDCKVCQNSSIPFNQKNHFVCISNSQLETFYNFNLYKTYCDSYTQDNNGILICNSCKKGYIFQNNDCIEACQLDESSMEDFLLIENNQLHYKKQKMCFGAAKGKVNNADKYGLQDNFDGSYAPLNFSQSITFKIDHTQTTDVLIATKNNVPFGKAVSDNLYIFPKITETVSVGSDNKCYIFQNNPNSSLSCATCNFGHFGIIKNWQVSNCHTYDEKKCIKCVYGMIPSENGLSCINISVVKGCKRYASDKDKCLECHEDYYLDYESQICSENTITNCLYPNKFNNNCWKCKEGFQLNTNKDKCFAEIEHCKTYDLTGSSSVCLLCHHDYYLDSQKCVHIPDKYCWFWENGSKEVTNNVDPQKKCLFYSNTIEVFQANQCQIITTVKHCVDYEENTCTVCEDNHYLIEGHCCLYGTYPNSTDSLTEECSNKDVDNCLTYKKEDSENFICDSCKNFFHLTQVPNTKGKCCENGEFWENTYDSQDIDQGNGQCSKILDYNDDSRNKPKCLLFSNDKQKCNVFKSGYYQSNDHYCPEEQYWDIEKESCQSISANKITKNCLKWGDDGKCSLCKTDFLNINDCCDTKLYLKVDKDDATKSICAVFPIANCQIYDAVNEVCTKCIIINSEDCCEQTNEYFDQDTQICKAVDTTIVGCDKYDSEQNCSKCISPSWLNPKKSCCMQNTFWNGISCQSITYLTNTNASKQCVKIEKGVFKNMTKNNEFLDFMCTKCEAGSTLTFNTEDQSNINTERIKCDTNSLANTNCAEIYFEYPVLDANDTQNKCKQCTEDYAIQKDYTCCTEGKITLENATCIDMQEQLENCYYFDLNKFECKDLSNSSLDTIHQDYNNLLFKDKGVCSWNIQGVYSFDSGSNNSCKLPKDFNTNLTSVSDCQVYDKDNSTKCLQCDDDYYLKSDNTCVDYSNCIHSYKEICQNCKTGFLSVNNETTPCSDANGETNLPTSNCSFNGGTDSSGGCTKCQQGYSLFELDLSDTTQNKCCQYGYYFNNDVGTCVQISNSYCAVQKGIEINSQTGRVDCQTCFISTDLCDTEETLFFDLEQPNYSINLSRIAAQESSLFQKSMKKVQYYHYQNIWFDDDQKQCCPHGEYFSKSFKDCISLDIKNCLTGAYDDASKQTQCSICEVGYQKVSNKCVKIIDNNCSSTAEDPINNNQQIQMYNSQGNCCLQGTMWSSVNKKCIPIVDPFCLQSQFEGKCSLCIDGYTHELDMEKQSLPEINFVFKNYNSIKRCPSVKRNFKYQSCIPNTIANDTSIYTYDKAYLKIQHCAQFKFINFETCTNCNKCTKCMSYAYMVDEDKGICCKKGEIFLDNICQKANQIDIFQKCYSFDFKKEECTKCLNGFNLQLGVCCPDGYYINPQNKECKYYFPDCAQFKIEFSTCDQCYPGFYMSDGKCCSFGKSWNSISQECESFSLPTFYSCREAASQNYCAKCTDQNLEYSDHLNNKYSSNVYLYQGLCFGERSFLPEVIDTPETSAAISTLRDLVNVDKGMFHCIRVDEYKNCIKCVSGYNLYTHKFVSSTRLLTDYSAGNTHTICCPSGYYYTAITDSGFTCINPNYNKGCDKMIKNTDGEIVCDSCLNNYYKNLDHCCKEGFAWSKIKHACTKIYIQELHNCFENSQDDSDICTKCQDDYYLSFEKICCKNKYYWDKDSNTCLSMSLLHFEFDCLQVLWEADKYICSKCNGANTIFDSSNNQCIEKVDSKLEDINCDVKTTVLNSENCMKCTIGSYKSIQSQKQCCLEGQYYDYEGNLTCKDLNVDSNGIGDEFKNCKIVKISDDGNGTVTYDCTECKDNHLKVGTTDELCTLINIAETTTTCALLRATPDQNCAMCGFGFYTSNSSQTTCINDNLKVYGENESKCAGAPYDTNKGECLLCKTSENYYTTKKHCCLQGYYWNSEIGQCQEMNFKENQFYCSQVNDEQVCKKCDYNKGFYNANDDPISCCPFGYYYDKSISSCSNDFSQLSESLQDCNFFYYDSSILQCRNPTDEENEIKSGIKQCKTGTYYFNKQRCCKNEEFYYKQGLTCNKITAIYPDLQNCQQLDDNNQCKKCKNDNLYISNGNCCLLNQYLPIDSDSQKCIQITHDSSCLQMNFDDDLKIDKCTKCLNDLYNDEYPMCCKYKYVPDGQSVCQNNLPNCNLMNPDGSCKICIPDYYVTNGNCCKSEYYYDAVCKIIPIEHECLQIQESKDFDPFYCSLCKLPTHSLQITDGKCCQNNYIFIRGHPLGNCLPKENLFEYCETFDKEVIKCIECKANYDLTNGICCPSGTHPFLNLRKHYLCIPNTIDNCLIQDSLITCSKCNEGYYLTNTNKTCCKIGHLFSQGKCSDQSIISECTEFNGDGQCMSCDEKYYISEGSDGKNYCCKEGKYVKVYKKKPICVKLSLIADNCSKWDSSDTVYECETCKDNTYKTGPVCCNDGTYFKINAQEEAECASISEQQDCAQISEEGNCLKCTDDTKYYITNDQCCPLGRYWDRIHKVCKENLKSYCEKYVDGDNSNSKCSSCLQTFRPNISDLPGEEDKVVRIINKIYLIQEHCCPEKYYWDDSENVKECVKKIKNCKKYKDNKNEDKTNKNTLIQCSECDDSYVKTYDLYNCCQQYEFYHEGDEKCVSNEVMNDVYSGCIDWDEKSLLCQKCDSKKYYLSISESNDVTLCCPYDEYVDDVTKICVQIDSNDNPSCSEISQGKCINCKKEYKLNESNNKCVQILNGCTQFDPENKTCTECDLKYYLNNGICCQEKQFAIEKAGEQKCVTKTDQGVAIANCLKYQSGNPSLCSQCAEKYYLTSNKSRCVSEMKFWNGSSEVVGNVKFCLQYGDSADKCQKCFHSHSKMSIFQNYEIPIDQNLSTTTLRAFYLLQPNNVTSKKDFCLRTELDNCQESAFDIQDENSTKNKVTCSKCQRNYSIIPIDDYAMISKFKQHYKIDNCKHQITHYLYSLSTFQCVECENDFFLDKVNNKCTLRTSEYTSNCLRQDLFNDKCLKCTIRYSLLQGKCVIPDLPCVLLSSDNQCQACNSLNAYTYYNINLSLKQQCRLHNDFKGEDQEHDEPDIYQGHMSDCQPHHQCTDSFLSNLNVDTHKYLSCHVCKDADRIPFISLSISNNGDINGIKRYSMWNTSDQKLTNFLKNQQSKQSECFKTDFSEFNLLPDQSADLFPDNCAVGAFNSDHPLNLLHSSKNNADEDFNYLQATAICLECKPGYRPLRNTFFKMVRRCEAIENCRLSQGTSFSQCDVCAEGYYFKYNPQKFQGGIDKSYCIKATIGHDQFCYAFNETQNKCHTCLNGYSQNHDGVCEKLISPFCEGEFNFNQNFTKGDYILAYYKGEQGCTQCQEGYERIYRNSNDFVCFSTNYQRSLPENTNYIPHCEYYFNSFTGANNKVLNCYKCAETYIFTNEGKCILKNDALNNCKIAESENLCHTCMENYFLINELCITGQQENCRTYSLIEDQLICNRCQDYYFLKSDNTCQKGDIQFCREFNGLTSCVNCDVDYQLVILKNNKHYCLPIKNLTNDCQEGGLSSLELTNMKIDCQTCKPNTILQQITPKDICVRFNLIKNCINYNRGSNFNSSTLKCLKCERNTFLNAKEECQDRLNYVANCSEYSLSNDFCSLCNQNYWLDANLLICHPKPQGLLGCSQFESENSCAKCMKEYYLVNGQCIVLNSESQIRGCTAYDSQQQCIDCEEGTSLINQQCEANIVPNCKIHQTPNSCKTCQDGYGITNFDDLNNCILLTSIMGCILQSQFQPYLCDICEAKYYLNSDGICEELVQDKIIAGCLVYGNQQLCQKCEIGYALSSTNDFCFKIHEHASCTHFKETQQNFCDLCQPGYKLDLNGRCVSILTQTINGCFTTKYENDNQCAVCTFGFYMKDDFNCVSYQVIDNNLNNGDNGQNENNNGDGNTSNNEEILGMALRIVSFLYLIF